MAAIVAMAMSMATMMGMMAMWMVMPMAMMNRLVVISICAAISAIERRRRLAPRVSSTPEQPWRSSSR